MARKTRSAALAQQILELLACDPGRVTKPTLLEQRRQIIGLCAEELAEKPRPIRNGRWGEDYGRAVRIVLGYQGPVDFIHSLRDGLMQYGSLTTKQAEAVLRPPAPSEVRELANMGVEGVEFSWQVRDALRAARQRDLARLREELTP